MAHLLYKSEPASWSWEHQKAAGENGTEWTGVRNYLARNNMRAMHIGDKGFFYHSNDRAETSTMPTISSTSL
ncbi:EVE domain-containing protein, partial [Rhizobium ruizarguesonis]